MNSDIIRQLCRYMNNKQKINLLSLNTVTHSMKMRILFTKQTILDNIIGLSYFDQFTNVFVRNRFERLPENVKIVQFDDNFNDDIHNLKRSKKVTHVIFGRNFNRPIVGCIPDTVRYLSFGAFFDQPIEGAIPNGVVNLKFGRGFNRPIENGIPQSVKYLTFGKGFTHVNGEAMPRNLINLQLPHYWSRCHTLQLPPNLTHLLIRCTSSVRKIPSSIVFLELLMSYSQNIPDDFIPYGVKTLVINGEYNVTLPSKLPLSIEHLRLNMLIGTYNLGLVHSSIKSLELSSYLYDQFIATNHRSDLVIKRLK